MCMDIPQKDIVEMNSHVFKISPGENIVKALSEGKICMICIVNQIVQMYNGILNETCVFSLTDDKAAVRLFLRFLKKYFPEFTKIISSKDADITIYDVGITIYVNTKFNLKTSFQLNRENNGNHAYRDAHIAYFIVTDDSSKILETVVINFRKCDFTALAWNLFKEDPVDVIRYARTFPDKTERTNRRLKQMYDSLSDSDKLLLEIDG